MSYEPHLSGGSSDEPGRRYLESIVGTASPAKLRLMLIERAADVASGLAASWREESPTSDPNAASLRLLELLNELLDGVTSGGDSDLSRRVADLYVFLIQHLIAAERREDGALVEEIESVLRIEAETWRAVCAREGLPTREMQSRVGNRHPSTGLNLQA